MPNKVPELAPAEKFKKTGYAPNNPNVACLQDHCSGATTNRAEPSARPKARLSVPLSSSEHFPLATQSQFAYFSSTVKKPKRSYVVVEGRCTGHALCPLSRVQAGAVVCIKKLSTAPEVTERLRELGFCEEQQIKLLSRESNLICQVCNARLGISEELADSILVEALASPLAA
jgi:Fe2+ transport system protein FeoA